MRIIFFGTHNLATTILKALIETPDFEIAGVVTQPDKPAGRGNKIQSPPVKELAKKNGLQVLQFAKLDSEAVKKIRELNADIFVAAEYGLIIPKTVLDIPPHGTLNVHPSLLPKYRGASPIQSAILSGDKETGVTIMLLDEEMDHGPIVEQQKCSIGNYETAPELENKLASLGSELLIKTIPEWVAGKIEPKKQNHDEATYCKKISREDGKVNWNLPANEIYNRWRAFQPWPGVYTEWNGKRLRLQKIKKTRKQENKKAGEIYLDKDKNLAIACAANAVAVDRLQLEGKKEIEATAFINGHPDFVGSIL